MPITVEISSPGRSARVISVTDLVTSIGRSSRSGIVIDSDFVSSRHAVLKIYSEGVTIEDSGSLNGTYLHGQKIIKPVLLENGSQVSLGVGGPTVKILTGSVDPATSHTSRPDTSTSTSGSRSFIFIASSLIVVATLFLICGIAGVGGVLFALNFDPNVIADAKDQLKIERALGKIIVGIEGKRGGEPYQIPLTVGTGFLITSDGYIVTNKHVVEDAVSMDSTARASYAAKLGADSAEPRVWISFGKEIKEAEIVHVSEDYDFSLLKIERKDSPFFRLASVAEIPRLADVYALGYPGISTKPVSEEEIVEEQIRQSTLHAKVKEFFKSSDFQYDSTSGTVSRVRKEQLGRLWVQHNAAINGGNSGGPLCLGNGLVVGINTLTMKDSQGVFFALAVSQLNEEIEQHKVKASWGRP